LNQTIGHMLDLQVDTVVEAATALLKRSDPLLDEARSHATDL
jgi:hypothetical protein